MTVHDPYAVTPRKPLTDKQRMQLFLDQQGVCCECGGKINGSVEAWEDVEPFIDEHYEPLWRMGDNDWRNRKITHVKCAKVKTAREATERAKGRRTAEKHFGAHRPKGKPMAGTKRSGLRKKMDGTVERR